MNYIADILDSMEVSTDTEHHNHSKSMFVDTAAQLPRIQVQKPASLVLLGELKVTGYSSPVLFNCACARTTLHGL